MEKEEEILDKLFRLREEELGEDIEEDIKCLKDKLKDSKQEDLVQMIEELPNECAKFKKEILEKMDDLIMNYTIKIAYYNKKYYKQGFKDAIELENFCKKIK